MLRPRTAGIRAVTVPLALAFSILAACAQTGQQGTQQKDAPDYSRAQTLEESTRFLKSLPPKPATPLPFPSINTPPIEDQAPVPLLTEAQQKKMEEDLEALAKGQGQPKKRTEKRNEKKQDKKPGEKAVKKKKNDAEKAAKPVK